MAIQGTTVDPSTPATCRIVRPEESYHGQQGLDYFVGISAESVGAQGLCMHLVKLPPGARAKAHLHADHESAAYVVYGEIELRHGDRLEHHSVVQAGEFVYIPAGVPHVPCNVGTAEALAVLARTDASEQESVVLLPELD